MKVILYMSFLPFSLLYLSFLPFPSIYMCAGIWSLEDNLQGLVLSTYNMGPRDQAQVVRIDSKPFYLSCHFAGFPLTF